MIVFVTGLLLCSHFSAAIYIKDTFNSNKNFTEKFSSDKVETHMYVQQRMGEKNRISDKTTQIEDGVLEADFDNILRISNKNIIRMYNRKIPIGCVLYDTLYPPWDLWDHTHRKAGAGLYSDAGYEQGSLYDVFAKAVTAAYPPFGSITTWQDVWNNESWVCDESNYYIFTFNYNSWGSASFFGSPVNIGASAAFGFVYIFFTIADNQSEGTHIYQYNREIFHGSDIVIPYTWTWDESSVVSTPPIYLQAGDTVTFIAGIEVVCSSTAVFIDVASGWIKANGKSYSIGIDQGTPSSPLFRIDPDPPNHVFQKILRDMEINWTFNIWNGGIDTLTWTIDENVPWMEITPSSSSSDGEVIPTKVIINTSGLDLGNYTGEFTINSNMESRTGLIKFELVNAPPYTPNKPSGPVYLPENYIGKYTTNTSDYEGNQIWYKFDWGDDTCSDWLGPYDSGINVEAEHKWATAGTYYVKVKAKDIHNDESNWSEPFEIVVYVLPSLYGGKVSPERAVEFTNFTYEVKYRDLKGAPPKKSTVYICTSHGGCKTYDMKYIGGDYSTEATYRYTTSLKANPYYFFYFEFEDIHDRLIRAPSEYPYEYIGPMVYPENNQPPTKPSRPTGPQRVIPHTTFKYETSSIDPDGPDDKIYYRWDWDDGYGPGPWNHPPWGYSRWDKKGTYYVKVQARDLYGFESDWSEPLKVTVALPRFMSFIKQYPITEKIFKKIRSCFFLT